VCGHRKEDEHKHFQQFEQVVLTLVFHAPLEFHSDLLTCQLRQERLRIHRLHCLLNQGNPGTKKHMAAGGAWNESEEKHINKHTEMGTCMHARRYTGKQHKKQERENEK
jgi:hypothetical protein